MNISVIGTGYVGLVQGIILADFGFNVICMDTDTKKIENLKKGIVPIFEPGLSDLLKKNMVEKRIVFTSKIKKTVQNSDVIFIAVGTPPNEDGSADLKHVLSVAKDIGKFINGYKVVVDKSTVPVGTGRKVKETINFQMKKNGNKYQFDIVSNPEFMREGKAINDCLRPDRVIIGLESQKAQDVMKRVYNPLYLLNTPFVFTNIETAEMIKYASNSFLAVKISFINEIALLAEKVGADVQQIAYAMGFDGRISSKFLHAGAGFGGSCFPKDTRAIVDIAKKHNEQFLVVQAAIKANIKQSKRMVKKIIDVMGNLKDKTIGLLGLSFKPDTDDVREAPSLFIIQKLSKEGAKIKVYCPAGMKEAKWRLKELDISYCSNEYEALEGSDAAVLITEWNQFRGMDLQRIKSNMKGNFFFDLRNVFAKNSRIRELFRYFPVGLK